MKDIYQKMQNIDAEKSLLGSILISPDTGIAIDEANQILQPIDFYRPQHREIYLAMLELFKENKPADNVTVVEQLNKRHKLEYVGGIAYITSLADCVPSAARLKYYAKIVKEKSTLRKLCNTAQSILDDCENNMDTGAILDKAEQGILDISKISDNDRIVEPVEVITKTYQELEERCNRQQEGRLSGINTGFTKLNEMTGGLQKNNLIIIGARPAMGKTSFALTLALNVALQKIAVAIFSLEMSKEQLTERLISIHGEINSNRMRNGTLNSDELNYIVDACTKLAEIPLFINDTSNISISQLRTKVRKLKREKNIELIIIDYLQLMCGTKSKGDFNRVQEISEISRELKLLAKELNITVIALSQLSRNVETRQSKKPMLSDLRESGAIEQDADIVAFLYRDEYYNEKTDDKRKTELIIAKHRSGDVGMIELKFKKQFCKFENYIKA
ncbi:replicative DNA helicase [Megamonas hypermegale]|uniref:replicative DNA helicase n=1 Tax=Megamonas hypermegale TaxID=158847 RepID=UPI0026F09703|nr:replicative DNA helicase [Megamonas hypermegale]